MEDWSFFGGKKKQNKREREESCDGAPSSFYHLSCFIHVHWFVERFAETSSDGLNAAASQETPFMCIFQFTE